MDFENTSVKFSEIKEDERMADLYTTVYAIPKNERVKVVMSWLANAYSDLLIPYLTEADVLNTFIVHVRLLDTFANNSSYETVAQLASEFSDKFLKSQVLPNLLQDYERTSDVTFYTQILCEHLTCPSLIRKLMDVVTSDLTPTLISRMVSDNQSVSSATLGLIKTLLEFYCEDLWYELILQYLLPMKHLLTSQRQKMLPEIEFYESTNKLLELIPNHVSDTIKPLLLAQHFLLYYQDETLRRRVIDSAIATSIPSSRSELQKVGLGLPRDFEVTPSPALDEMQRATKKSRGNATYPMWVFQYDGTDFLHALRGPYLQEPEEFFEDDLFSATNQLNSSSISNFENDSGFPMSQSEFSIEEENLEIDAGAISENLDENFQEDVHSLSDDFSLSPAEENRSISVVKDKRSSFELLNESDRYHNSYFGPFLNALYDVMQKWTKVDPNVLFTVTEIISVLASSRIPLINTLFLDMTLTLQPSFPSFPTLLHKIRTELDEVMKTYPDFIFRSVWRSAAKDCTIPEIVLDSDDEDGDNSERPSIINSLRRAIGASSSLRISAQGLGTRGKPSTPFRALSDIFKSPNKSSIDTSSEFRLLNRASTPFETQEEEDCAKNMALRSVLFTHWMLELGAIAMQLCWGPKSLLRNQNDSEIRQKDLNADDV